MSFYRFFQAGPKKRAVLPTAAPYGFVLAGMASETQVHLDGHVWVRPCAWRRGIALRPFECCENHMFRSLRSLASVTFTAILMIGMAPVFAQTAKDDVKGAKEDIKDAGKSTGRAAKKTGKAVKKTTKKAVNKTAEKTEEGADAVRRKTNP